MTSGGKNVPATPLPTSAGPTSPHIAPLTVWLLIQFAALLLGVLQVPLSANFIRPAERAAIYEMLAVQVGASALLLPILFRSWGTSLIVIAASWPFLQLAGVLSAAPAGHVLAGGVYLTGWLTALALLGSLLRSDQARLYGAATATLIAIGGSAIAYLRGEFVTATDPYHNLWGPIVGALGVAGGEKWAAEPWLVLLTLLLSAAGAATARKLARR